MRGSKYEREVSSYGDQRAVRIEERDGGRRKGRLDLESNIP